MASVKDIFQKLKVSIVGTKTTSIDTKLNNAVNDIIAYKSHSGRNGYIDLVKHLISKSGDTKLNDIMYGGAGAANSPAMFGQQSRLNRYNTYDSIVGNISYCSRALNVLIDNILSPDDITKTVLEVTSSEYVEETSTDNKQDSIKALIKDIKLEYYLDLIVKNTLQFGDFFVEIASEKEVLTSRSYLMESNFIHHDRDIASNYDKFNISMEDGASYKVSIDYSSIREDDDSKKEKLTNRDLRLLFHHPKNVIKLQSEIYPLCFGYLIFPKYALNPQLIVQDQKVNQICNKILNSIQAKVPDVKNISDVHEKDLKDLIAQMVKESDPNKILNVRFVPADRMEHFHVPSTKFYPYGESIFESVTFLAKMLTCLETALTIFRLNRSTEKRKIMIDVGLTRDVKKEIENIKEQFKKRKISLGDMSVDTIPSMVSTFEDFYLPQKDGKAFVDIQSFTEGNVDTRAKADEIKVIRDMLVAGLGVPASFLGLEENISNKAALSEENILFARTVINNQKFFTTQINSLIQKVLDITNPEDALEYLENMTIALPSPKSLQFERQARYTNDIIQLIEGLERIGVPKEYSKKKYLTSIDWDEVDEFKTGEQVDKSLGTEPEQEDALGMGGIGGAGMGGVSGGMGGF